MRCIFCKKEQQPKFKIWDYAVESEKYNNFWNDEFIKIFSIQKKDWRYIYNIFYWYSWYKSWLVEEQLRKPTNIEEKIYFR